MALFRSFDTLLIVYLTLFSVIILGTGFIAGWKKVLPHIFVIIYNIAWICAGIWFYHQPLTMTNMAIQIEMPMIIGVYAIGTFIPWFLDSILA